MTTETANRRTARTRFVAAGMSVAFALVATACGGSSDSSPEPVVEIADDDAGITSFDDLEYGDSIEELHNVRTEAEPVTVSIPGFQLVEWDDLIPPDFSSEQILDRYEDRLASSKPGSPELDALYEEMNAEYDAASINPEFDGEKVQLAGFVAPLTYDGDEIIEFLLVPYFGACIHVPPPPVNQTVMVTLAEGESLSLEESWGAVWVAGEMSATPADTDLATAGYTISGPAFGVYDTQ